VPDDAVDTAHRIARAVLAGNRNAALRGFIDYSDTLRRGVDLAELSSVEPPRTGSEGWDSALAAVVDYWLGKAHVAVPSWANDSSRTSTQAETPHLGPYDLPPDLTNVPDEFLRRNILIERSTLASI
jgi:hypothetical protein